MLWPAFLFLAAIFVRSDSTPLRSGCEPGDAVVATLAANTAVQLQFSVNDGSGCLKISAVSAGQAVQGYLPARALAGLEQFDQERRSASPVQALKRSIVLNRDGDAALRRGVELLEQRKPSQALKIIEPLLARSPPDPEVLVLGGLAAYRLDQVPRALGYWRSALEVRPDEALERFCRRLERETANDRSTEKLYGLRVLLRYDSHVLDAGAARSLVSALDEELTRIAEQLGCQSEERVVAILQDRQAYLRSTDAAEWTGGLYDGRIRVALPEPGHPAQELRKTLAHETVHACLAELPGAWPAWLQEGLAQKLSGDVLTPAVAARVCQLASSHALPRLENMSQSWSRMSAQHARDSYAVALAAANLLMENYAAEGLRNLLNNPSRFDAITAGLDRLLGL